MRQIPVIPISSRQALTVTLGADTYTIYLWWSPLSESWFLSLRTTAGVSIAEGRQIAPYVRLVRERAFPGDLAVIGLSLDEASELNRQMWQRYQLVSLSAAEASSLA